MFAWKSFMVYNIFYDMQMRQNSAKFQYKHQTVTEQYFM